MREVNGRFWEALGGMNPPVKAITIEDPSRKQAQVGEENSILGHLSGPDPSPETSHYLPPLLTDAV